MAFHFYADPAARIMVQANLKGAIYQLRLAMDQIYKTLSSDAKDYEKRYRDILKTWQFTGTYRTALQAALNKIQDPSKGNEVKLSIQSGGTADKVSMTYHLEDVNLSDKELKKLEKSSSYQELSNYIEDTYMTKIKNSPAIETLIRNGIISDDDDSLLENIFEYENKVISDIRSEMEHDIFIKGWLRELAGLASADPWLESTKNMDYDYLLFGLIPLDNKSSLDSTFHIGERGSVGFNDTTITNQIYDIFKLIKKVDYRYLDDDSLTILNAILNGYAKIMLVQEKLKNSEFAAFVANQGAPNGGLTWDLVLASETLKKPENFKISVGTEQKYITNPNITDQEFWDLIHDPSKFIDVYYQR